jgi:hypothetical protein
LSALGVVSLLAFASCSRLCLLPVLSFSLLADVLEAACVSCEETVSTLCFFCGGSAWWPRRLFGAEAEEEVDAVMEEGVEVGRTGVEGREEAGAGLSKLEPELLVSVNGVTGRGEE